jgi:hypothetical protein
LIDNLWSLINKSRIQPEHQQEMARVIMIMKKDCEKGLHQDLDNVLYQIITVLSGKDQPEEQLASMMASNEQADSRHGCHEKGSTSPVAYGNKSRSDGTLSRILDKLYRTLCDIKSDLGNIRKSSQYEVAKNDDVTVQKHKTFGSRNNEKPALHANSHMLQSKRWRFVKHFHNKSLQ